jgi:hypothetical protein
MPGRNALALTALMTIVLTLTGIIVGGEAKPPLLGGLAPLLILSLLIWYLIILIVNRKEIIAGIATTFNLRRKPEFARTNFWSTIVVYVVLFSLGITIFWFGVPQRILRGMQGIFPTSGTVSNSTQPNPLTGFFPTVAVVYIGVLVTASIFIMSFLLLIGGIRLALNTKEIRADDSSRSMEEEAAEVVQQTITGLKTEREYHEYHEIILQCYVKMCSILARAGMELSPAETAREFAENISTKLHVGEKAVSGLTFLFEEARYSKHEISEEKRIMALNYLTSLQQALSANVGMSV